MQENQYDAYARKVWRNICPSKAELLLWLVLQGKVDTQDRLRRFNILKTDDCNCVLCGAVDESVQHLFFTCSFAWKVWTNYCQIWGITWVISNDPRLNFESWIATSVGRQ